MDLITEIPMVGYFIYRSGEQSDPTTSLEFCPPKDSDELFFALKTAHPLVKTHSERMRNAVIEFLIKERDEEQTRNQMAAPPAPVIPTLSHESSAESPWHSWPSVASNSTLSSPDLVDLATPASMSPHLSQAQGMSRQNSQAQSSTASTNTPAMEQMTGVFSLSSVPQVKTRVRRKMTEAEKAEYRKRRVVKACDSCSKRKRKCNHNASQMDRVASSSKVTKTKPSAPSTSASVIQTEQLERDMFHHLEPSESSNDPFAFLDEDMFSELPALDDHAWLANTEFDDLFTPKAAPERAPAQIVTNAWPWSETPDWTLLGTPQQANASLSPSYTRPLFPSSTGLLSPTQTPLLQLDNSFPSQTQWQPETEHVSAQSPTRSWRNFSDFSRTAFSTADGRDGQEMPLFHSPSAPAIGDLASSYSTRPLFSPTETLTGTQFDTSSSSTCSRTATKAPRSNMAIVDYEPCLEASSSSGRKKGFKRADNPKKDLGHGRSVLQTSASVSIPQTRECAAQATISRGHADGATMTAELRAIDGSQARSNNRGQLPLPRQSLPGAGTARMLSSSQGASGAATSPSSFAHATSSSNIVIPVAQASLTPAKLKAIRARLETSNVARVSIVPTADPPAASASTTAARPASSTQDHRSPSVGAGLASHVSGPRVPQDAESSSSQERASPRQSSVPAQVCRSPAARLPQPAGTTAPRATQALVASHGLGPTPPSQQWASEPPHRTLAQSVWRFGAEEKPALQAERHYEEMRTVPTTPGAELSYTRASIDADCPSALAINVVMATLMMEICTAGQAVVTTLLQAMLTQASTSSVAHAATTEARVSTLATPVAPV